MRPLVLACILAIAGSSAAGQTTPDNASIAWTAYRAAEAGDPSQVASLQALLPPLLERKTDEGRYALGAVLDALWRLDARPALDLIPRIYETHPVEAIMFLTRFGAERDEVALALLRKESSYEWLALANLLLQTRAVGLAETIVRDLRLTVRITVSDDGESLSWSGVGAGLGCNALRKADGFPPLAAFRLEPEWQKDAPVLVGGPRTVRFQRVPGRRGIAPGASTFSQDVTADDRLAYLGALLRTPTLDVTGYEHHGLAWNRGRDLSARIIALKRDADRRYEQLLDALASAEVLTATERAGRRSQVQLEIVDLRRDRSRPLPAI